MSKDTAGRVDTPPHANDMATLWASRGYRQPLEDTRQGQVEDSKGEEAYQRCFARAAKLDPPRLPNASFFENSPSAVEYLKKCDQDPDQRQRNPNFVPISKDLHRAHRSSHSPAESASRPQSHVNPAGQAPGITSAGAATDQGGQGRSAMPRPPDTSQRFADPRYHQGQSLSLPTTLEPTFDPTGPGRMLR